MPRRSQNYTKVTCVKGIDQQEGLADPLITCADARNVWAPDGKLIKRPGYIGVGQLSFVSTDANCIDPVGIKRVGTVYTTADPLNVGGLTAGDSWFLGFDLPDATWDISDVFSISTPLVGADNSASVIAAASYWNGSSWALLPSLRQNTRTNMGALNYPTDSPVDGGFIGALTHLGFGDNKNCIFYFVPPRDWVKTNVDGSTKYFLRFTIVSGTISALTELTPPTEVMVFKHVTLASEVAIKRTTITGLFAATFPTLKAYFATYSTLVNQTPFWTDTRAFFPSLQNFDRAIEYNGLTYPYTNLTYPPNTDLSVAAIIPQFEEVYLARSFKITKHNAAPLQSAGYWWPEPKAETDIDVSVETDPLIIGPGAKYDPVAVPQLTFWPTAKYIEFYQGQMWAMRLQDDPYGVRWSAPIPYYKVWPLLNYEPLMENDNSEISGIKGFQGHMTVFKGDSIWRMVDTGVSDFGLQTYSPERVINGVGCVSHHSIQEVQNNLVFLAEDGIYLYNGTTEVRKISTRIQQVINSISPSKRETCTAVVWRSKSLYMLAVNNGQAQNNNLVLVWDYKNDAWWIWDDMTVVSWLHDENSADNETIYFGDDKGAIYQLGVGATSNGAAITSTLTTQRINGDQWSKALRQVEIIGTNDTRSLSVKLASNDAPLAQATATTLDFTDAAEKDWGSATWAVDSYVASRARQKKLGCRKDGEWFQLQVQHNTKNAPMEISEIHMGSQVLGRRK